MQKVMHACRERERACMCVCVCVWYDTLGNAVRKGDREKGERAEREGEGRDRERGRWRKRENV